MTVQKLPFTTPLVPDLQYFDDYLSVGEEHELLSSISSHPHAWKSLKNRTLQNWGGLPHIKGMLPISLPNFLHPLLNRLHGDIFEPCVQHRPNHVLINRYEPSQGIDPHVDGPAYKPCAAIVSLAAPIVMHFYDDIAKTKNDNNVPMCALLLRPRSLVVLSGRAYTDVYHAILERDCDVIGDEVVNATEEENGTTIKRTLRTSLTVRTACRTISNPLLGRILKK